MQCKISSGVAAAVIDSGKVFAHSGKFFAQGKQSGKP